VTVSVRFADFRSVTRSVTSGGPISATLTITELAMGLVDRALADHRGEREITLLGVSVSNLVDEPSLQLELPLGLGQERERPGTPKGAARWSVDRSVDAVRSRFGSGAIDYAGMLFSGAGQIPDGFRELAEHPLRVLDGQPGEA
jgi:DNA polymerase-4